MVSHGSYGLAQADQYDLAVVGGGALRHDGANGRIIDDFVRMGKPAIMCEFGRLVPDTLMLVLGKKPWLPSDAKPSDRLRKFGFIYNKQPRGENVLFCGQRPNLDQQLEETINTIRANTDRKIVFRPHPGAWRTNEDHYVPSSADEVSSQSKYIDDASRKGLEQDIDEAWCVITHSSLAIMPALLRGTPVIATDSCVVHPACTPLSEVHRVEEIQAPSVKDLYDVLCRYSYCVWTFDEIAEGKAFKFMSRYFGGMA
jgi:hypothetical protein